MTWTCPKCLCRNHDDDADACRRCGNDRDNTGDTSV